MRSRAKRFARLDDDRADAIVGDPGEQLSKAGPHLYRIGTAHRSGSDPVAPRGPVTRAGWLSARLETDGATGSAAAIFRNLTCHRLCSGRDAIVAEVTV